MTHTHCSKTGHSHLADECQGYADRTCRICHLPTAGYGAHARCARRESDARQADAIARVRAARKG
jgi:hypothetical protein